MHSIAICDDEEYEREGLHAMLLSWMEAAPAPPAHVYSYDSGKALLNAVAEYGPCEIYLLDVVMPDMNGIELGIRLRALDPNGIIIYLTTAPEFAVESYEVRAFHYLLKPVMREKLFDVLAEAVKGLDDKQFHTLRVHARDRDILLDYDDILYVEQSDRFPHYVCAEGTVVGMMLKKAFRDELGELLSDSRFHLCGASFLVNLGHIRSVGKTGITLSNGKTLSLPKSCLGSLRIEWTNFWLDRG